MKQHCEHCKGSVLDTEPINGMDKPVQELIGNCLYTRYSGEQVWLTRLNYCPVCGQALPVGQYEKEVAAKMLNAWHDRLKDLEQLRHLLRYKKSTMHSIFRGSGKNFRRIKIITETYIQDIVLSNAGCLLVNLVVDKNGTSTTLCTTVPQAVQYMYCDKDCPVYVLAKDYKYAKQCISPHTCLVLRKTGIKLVVDSYNSVVKQIKQQMVLCRKAMRYKVSTK